MRLSRCCSALRPGLALAVLAIVVPASAQQRSFFEGDARVAAFQEVDRLKHIQARHRQEIMGLPGVHGFGIGLDKASGRLDFLVLVEPHVPMPAVPSTIDSVPVRVKRQERATAEDGGAGCAPCHANQLATPVAMGNSGFSELACSACTMGFKACDLGTGNLVYITNAHCCTDAASCAGAAPIGTNMRHRSPLDSAGCTLQTIVGQTAGYANPACGVDNMVDGGKVDSDNTLTGFTVRDIGVPSVTPGTVLPGDSVQKSGRTTGLTTGTVDIVAMATTVCNFPGTSVPYCCAGVDGCVDFVDQIMVTGAGVDWSMGGDSGSGVFTTGSPPQLVGLHFAGSGFSGTVNTIANVLSDLDLSLDPCDCTGVCSGACCDVLAGTCNDDVFKEDCQGAGQQFFLAEQCNALSAPCLAAGPDAKMIVLLDRSGSMNKVRMTGNTRCLDALQQAKDDVEAFTVGFPDREVAVWTFSGSAPTDEAGGFVDGAAALVALGDLDGVACGGSTPLAEAICAVAPTFPAGLPLEDKLLSISSDGGENVSDGPCEGPYSVKGPPPSGNYDQAPPDPDDSWQWLVYETLLGEMIVNVRHWGAFGGSSFTGSGFAGPAADAVDPETGEPRSGILGVSDTAFFDDLTTANVGLYRQMDDGPEPVACISCTPEAQPPFECTGAETTVTLAATGFSLEGPVVPTWTPPAECTIAPGTENLFQTTADCSGKGDFVFTLRVTLDQDEDGVAEAGEPFSECELLVTVQDTTPPTLLGVPADLELECDQPVPPPASVTADDVCEGDIPVIFEERRINLACPDSFVLLRTWKATDGSDNTATAMQVIRVLDTTPPALMGVPADGTVECDSVPPPAVVGALDNCDPGPEVSFCERREDGDCPDNYTLTRTWTATDRCGNSASATQVITVQDTTPPMPMAALRPTLPRSALPPVSVCSATTSRTFQVLCSATDNCDPAPALAAKLLVTNHDVDDLGGCIDRLDNVDVACGEVVEIRLVSPPCPAKPPRSAVIAAAVNPAGIQAITGETVVLEVTATDRCDNSASDEFDPTVDPPTPCEQEHQDGTCCPALMQARPRSCPVPLCD